MREDGRGENIWGVFSHTLALDPLCLGEEYEKPDFIGLNLYQGAPVRAGENGPETLPSRRASRGPPWAGPSPRRPWSGGRGF